MRQDPTKVGDVWSAWNWKHKSLHKARLCPNLTVKCVWCERVVEQGREVDIEHFRPKGCVTEWTNGLSAFELTACREPPAEQPVGSGYWWLAFTWENLLVSCKPCNQTWKRNLFPLASRVGGPSEGTESVEQPLLLNPGESFATDAHFAWTDLGDIVPRSPRGLATVATCGLNRAPLVDLRRRRLEDLDRLLTCLLGDLRRREPVNWGPIFGWGARSAEFAGMVRWRTEQACGCAWQDIEGAPL